MTIITEDDERETTLSAYPLEIGDSCVVTKGGVNHVTTVKNVISCVDVDAETVINKEHIVYH